jgi:hypothetical protein
MLASEMRRFEYHGLADVRPIGRGVFLTNSNRNLDEVISELVDANAWGGRAVRLRIVVEAPDLEDEGHTRKRPGDSSNDPRDRGQRRR